MMRSYDEELGVVVLETRELGGCRYDLSLEMKYKERRRVSTNLTAPPQKCMLLYFFAIILRCLPCGGRTGPLFSC